MQTARIKPDELKRIVDEFTFDTGSTEYDDDFVQVINTLNELQKGDRIILSLYAELQSERKTAEILGVSRAAVRKFIKYIKGKFIL